MNANQQHMFDAYRAAQRGELAPPLPGKHDWEAIGEMARMARSAGTAPSGRRRAGRRRWWGLLRRTG
ncbi:hypothetical protein [Streptomyces sp. NBC_01766]|uniref:hypothetical protein n=1 Tax=Streptomyces sp. NBC_01766 TaxID=2975936 RepID=UPI002DD9E240|nr:hypothetical protein [Streptomyces sp. NBC_01766]WSC20716.1 hypothetical protein OIE60_14020 [Streptomyces sp. NBC_01766]